MLPGPLLGSPPETDQVTSADSPLAREARKRSTEVPLLLIALHPVQLVSMELVPGKIAKLALAGIAVTSPLAQPASRSSAGNTNRAATRAMPPCERTADRVRAGRR